MQKCVVEKTYSSHSGWEASGEGGRLISFKSAFLVMQLPTVTLISYKIATCPSSTTSYWFTLWGFGENHLNQGKWSGGIFQTQALNEELLILDSCWWGIMNLFFFWGYPNRFLSRAPVERPILTYILVALTSLSGLSKNHESRRQILGKGMWEEIVEERGGRYDSSLYIM